MQVVRFAVLAVFLLAAPSVAGAETYIVTAAAWARAQSDAVAAAGGSVVFSHAASGIAVVESRAADFAARLARSGKIQGVVADRVVQWQKPQQTVDLEADVAGGSDETFFNAQWNVQSIHAPQAWAAGCRGAGVRVAILDGGMRSTHVDLAGAIDETASRSFVTGQPWNSDTGTFWHASHVAGIVGARDNGIGTIGVAPDVTLIGVKVLHGGSGSFGAVISGLLYAATPIAEGGAGADVINMSLGAVFARNSADERGLVAAMNQAVNWADRFGVLVVSSAGNDELDLDHSGNLMSVPAESGSGVTVAATGPVGFAVGYPDGNADFSRPASYTNFGASAVFVSAPGGDFALPGDDVCVLPRLPSGTVANYCWVFDMVISPNGATSNTSYSFAAGTSMAAPAVAGVAALVKGQHPDISLGALKNAIAQSATDVLKPGADPYSGRGFVDAAAACAR